MDDLDNLELDTKEPDREVATWLNALNKSREKEKDWRDCAEKACKLYMAEDQCEFNILHSNVETILPAVFSAIPNPDVRQRYKDHDPVAKELAEITERSLSYCMDNDQYDFETTIETAIVDWLVAGRGIVMVDYEPIYGTQELEVLQPDGTVGTVTEVVLQSEQLYCQHVAWDQLYIHPARKWSAVEWVAVESFPTKEQVREMFPELPDGIEFVSPADADEHKSSMFEDNVESKKSDVADLKNRLQVFKIWDKVKREVVYISPGVKSQVLRRQPDPFGLPGFFPMPEPLQIKRNSKEMMPVAEYEFYRKQAEELNEVSKRITLLVKGLKVRGLISGAVEEAKNLANASDYDFISVSSAILKDGNINSMVWTMPVERIIQVLAGLYQQRDQIIEGIYQVTGISDVLRGASQPSETATAQGLKAQYGGLRIDRRRRAVAKFIRDVLRIKGRLLGQLEPQSIVEMTGKQPSMEALAMLQNDGLANYKIDIETDTTIAANQADDQKAITDLLTGIVSYMQGIAPLVQTGAIPIEAAKEILLAAVRRMKLGRAVEDALELIGTQQLQEQIGATVPPGAVPLPPGAVPPETVQQAF